MWKKIKDSKFGAKCRELSKNRGAVASLVCLVVAIMIVASVSIATNLAKKKYANEDNVSIRLPRLICSTLEIGPKSWVG